uniref:Uncharacterized protein n=1 Tax=Kalanchoe fedtschenkoi TaxID=63787 RepID=A0A7N0UPB3_KALFE
MPIGVPKVPFRNPGEEDASWISSDSPKKDYPKIGALRLEKTNLVIYQRLLLLFPILNLVLPYYIFEYVIDTSFEIFLFPILKIGMIPVNQLRMNASKIWPKT